MKGSTMRTESLYSGPLFSVRRDRVQLPNGRAIDLEIVDHPPVVTIIPLAQNGDIWFVRQYRHATGGWLLELPAGRIDLDEDPEKAAVRECREEIGLSPGELTKLGSFFQAPGYTTEINHVYLGRDLTPSPLEPDLDEALEAVNLPPSAIMNLMDRGRIRDAKTLAGLFLAFRWLNR